MRASIHAEKQIIEKIETDAEALACFKNTDGKTFAGWVEDTRPFRQKYETEIRAGYPARWEIAEQSAPTWEGWLGYAREQEAVAKSFLIRAYAVAREILAYRGVRATESGAASRTWEMQEEANRWGAIAETLAEWLYEARGREKIKNRPHGPGSGK